MLTTSHVTRSESPGYPATRASSTVTHMSKGYVTRDAIPLKGDHHGNINVTQENRCAQE